MFPVAHWGFAGLRSAELLPLPRASAADKQNTGNGLAAPSQCYNFGALLLPKLHPVSYGGESSGQVPTSPRPKCSVLCWL